MDVKSLKLGRSRRTYSAQFKIDMVAQCVQGTVSLASLAVEHGMNLNVLHRWVASTNGMGVMRQATASC